MKFKYITTAGILSTAILMTGCASDDALTDAQAQVTEATQQVAELQAQLDETQKALTDATSNNSELESKIADMESELADDDELLNGLIDEIEMMRGALTHRYVTPDQEHDEDNLYTYMETSEESEPLTKIELNQKVFVIGTIEGKNALDGQSWSALVMLGTTETKDGKEVTTYQVAEKVTYSEEAQKEGIQKEATQVTREIESITIADGKGGTTEIKVVDLKENQKLEVGYIRSSLLSDQAVAKGKVDGNGNGGSKGSNAGQTSTPGNAKPSTPKQKSEAELRAEWATENGLDCISGVDFNDGWTGTGGSGW